MVGFTVLQPFTSFSDTTAVQESDISGFDFDFFLAMAFVLVTGFSLSVLAVDGSMRVSKMKSWMSMVAPWSASRRINGFFASWYSFSVMQAANRRSCRTATAKNIYMNSNDASAE